MSAEGILDCPNCELYAGVDICPTVALNSIEELIISGFRPAESPEMTILYIRQNTNDPVIRPVIEEECNYKKLRHANTKSGNGQTTY